MNVKQDFQKQDGNYEKDVLFRDLKEMIPDFSYPKGFYSELKHFLFTNSYSFFDTSSWSPLLKETFQQLPKADKEDFLTVLEGAKAIILEYQLPDMAAYNQLMLESKSKRFSGLKS